MGEGHRLRQLIEHDDEGTEGDHPDHRVSGRTRTQVPVITGTQRSHSAGCRASSPTRSLQSQQRSHFRPGARSITTTSPGISWLSYTTAPLAGPWSSTRETMKSV